MNTNAPIARFSRLLGIAACTASLLGSATASAQYAQYKGEYKVEYKVAPKKTVGGIGYVAPGGGNDGGGKGDGPILGNAGKACRLMEMSGQLNEFIPGEPGETVWYSKSFQLFGDKAAKEQVPAQFLISVGYDVSGGFTFNYPQGIPGEPEIMAYQSGLQGAAVYLPTEGSMSVIGTPGDGEAAFTFNNLQLSEVNAATLQPIDGGDCIDFYDFSFEGGVVNVPADWTCAPNSTPMIFAIVAVAPSTRRARQTTLTAARHAVSQGRARSATRTVVPSTPMTPRSVSSRLRPRPRPSTITEAMALVN